MLTQYFPPEVGAAQTRLRAVADALTHLGDEVEVVTAMPNYPMGRIFDDHRGRATSTAREDGVTVRRVWMYAAMGTGARRIASYLSFSVTCLLGLARASRADAILVESPPLFAAVPGVLYGRARRIPVVLNVADLWPDAAVSVGALRPGRTLRLMLRLEAWVYRHARLVTTVTDGVRDKLVRDKGIEDDRILMLVNGVDTDLFHPAGGDAARRTVLDLPDGPFVIYAGTMGLAHGLDPLIDAWARLDPTEGPFLLMIGSGSERGRLEQRVAAEGLSNVVFRDPIPVDQLAELLPLASAGAVTLADIPINELARPAKMFPMMSCGVPVLFAGEGEGARIVGDADAGVVVPNDATAIVEAVRELMRSPQDARARGERGRAAVERDWSWKHNVDAWRSALAARLGEPARRA